MDEKKDYLSLSVKDFAAVVAAKTPTPGGGSVAGVVGALATGLGEMALNFTSGKKKFAQHQAFYDHLSARMTKVRQMFLDLVNDDVSAYSLYRDASAMADGPEKDAQVQLALAAAIAVPREMAKLCLAMMDDLVALSDKCNPFLISDLVAAAALAAATVRLCDYNVRVNLPQCPKGQEASDIAAASTSDLRRAEAMLTAIEQAAKPQLG